MGSPDITVPGSILLGREFEVSCNGPVGYNTSGIQGVIRLEENVSKIITITTHIFITFLLRKCNFLRYARA